MIQPFVAAALLVAQAAPAARPCITHEEAGDVAVAMLPYVLDAAAQRCRPHLPATAFLSTGAADWSQRLRQDAAPRRESALRGLSKLGGATPPVGASGAATFDFVAQLMTAALTAEIRPETCGQIDTIAQSLQPLPTDNIARLVGATLTLAMSTRGDEEEEEGAQVDDPETNEGDEPAAEAEEDRGPPICPA